MTDRSPMFDPQSGDVLREHPGLLERHVLSRDGTQVIWTKNVTLTKGRTCNLHTWWQWCYTHGAQPAELGGDKCALTLIHEELARP